MVNRALPPPVFDRVEQQLTAPIRVLLPSVDLIVRREGDALLESALGIASPADGVSAKHEPQGHIEVLRDVGLGPDLLYPVFVHEGGVLDGSPSEEGVVPDEGCDFTVCAC